MTRASVSAASSPIAVTHRCASVVVATVSGQKVVPVRKVPSTAHRQPDGFGAAAQQPLGCRAGQSALDIAAIKLPEGQTSKASLTVVRAGLIRAAARQLNNATMNRCNRRSAVRSLADVRNSYPCLPQCAVNVVDRALGHAPPRAPALGTSFPQTAVANRDWCPGGCVGGQQVAAGAADEGCG